MRLQRQHVGHVLVGAHDDHHAVLAVDAAQREDIGAVLQVGGVDLLVVDQPEAPLARQQQCRQRIDIDLAVALL